MYPNYSLKDDEMGCDDLILPFTAEHNDKMLTLNPASSIIDACRANGKRFVDRSFPPIVESANWNPKRPSSIKVDQWARISEICGPKPWVLEQRVVIEDVIQGYLGNCWFVQCLAGFAKRYQYLQRLIDPPRYNPEGCYGVKLFDEGRWHVVIVDDYIPCQKYGKKLKPTGTHARDSSCAWILILEKAFAKLHTCYQSMVGGSNDYCFGPTNVLRLMSGSPSGTIRLDGKGADKIWDELRRRTEQGWILGAGTKHNTTNKNTGLVYGHAYSIVDTCVVDGTYRLVCIRNTWGRKEWQGDWSDKSPIFTPERKEQVRSQTQYWKGVKNDGIFLMAIEDFVQQYEIIYFTDLVDDLYGHSAVVQSEWSGSMAGGNRSLKNPKIAFTCSAGASLHAELHVARADWKKNHCSAELLATSDRDAAKTNKGFLDKKKELVSIRFGKFSRDLIVQWDLLPQKTTVLVPTYGRDKTGHFALVLRCNRAFTCTVTDTNGQVQIQSVPRQTIGLT